MNIKEKSKSFSDKLDNKNYFQNFSKEKIERLKRKKENLTEVRDKVFYFYFSLYFYLLILSCIPLMLIDISLAMIDLC